MLYVFHGSDITQSVRKAHALIDSLRTKKPDAAYVPITADDWSNALIEEHVGGQGLFSDKYIVFLDRITENEEAKELVLEFIPVMNESANIFIVLEGELSAALKKAFEKHAEKVVMTDEKSAAKKKDFNIFALGDALGSRDSMKSWMLYRQAVENGLEPENVLGTIFWQVKSIALAASASTAGEAGLNPFVFGNSKRFAAKYSKTELDVLMKRLITLYHDGHRGMTNLELSIEGMLLGITSARS